MSDKIEKMLHDLRGTLVVIKSFLLAVEKTGLPEDIRELHAAAKNSVEKIKAMTESAHSD